ncbi:hypothetical protein Hanom_Chr10g00939751 [Helianthus anomalus]
MLGTDLKLHVHPGVCLDSDGSRTSMLIITIPTILINHNLYYFTFHNYPGEDHDHDPFHRGGVSFIPNFSSRDHSEQPKFTILNKN